MTSAGARLSGSANETAWPSELVETMVVPLVASEAKRDLRMAFSAAFGSVGLFSRAPRMMQRMSATRLTFIQRSRNVRKLKTSLQHAIMRTMADESKVRDVVDAVKGVAEAVPIYDDALKPAAKEIGKGLETIAKAVNVALVPIAALVWGYEKIKGFVDGRLSEKLKDVPPERIQTPPANVAGPALEALKYTGHLEDLREMYANLLANSMDLATVSSAHPAFVDIIRNLAPDEAKILKSLPMQSPIALIDITVSEKGKVGYLLAHRNLTLIGLESGCEHPHLSPNYLDNLVRLGLLEVPSMIALTDADRYKTLEEHPEVQKIKESFTSDGKHTVGVEHKIARLTNLGRLFVTACVIDKSVRDTLQQGATPNSDPGRALRSSGG